MIDALLLLATVAAFVWLTDRKDKRVARVLDARHPDLQQMIELVDRLCQRVQAPDQAILEHSIGVVPEMMPAPVLPTDDDAYWESREELAERAALQELSDVTDS